MKILFYWGKVFFFGKRWLAFRLFHISVDVDGIVHPAPAPRSQHTARIFLLDVFPNHFVCDVMKDRFGRVSYVTWNLVVAQLAGQGMGFW